MKFQELVTLDLLNRLSGNCKNLPILERICNPKSQCHFAKMSIATDYQNMSVIFHT